MQAYYNPFIVSLVTAMISGCPTGQTEQDRLRRNSFDVHTALPFARQAPEQARQCAVASHAMQIAVPDDFKGRTYGELYEHLMYEYDMVPVGLYRYGINLGNDLPFVFTNPEPATVVAPNDLVYVFAPCQLGCRSDDSGVGDDKHPRPTLPAAQPTSLAAPKGGQDGEKVEQRTL